MEKEKNKRIVWIVLTVLSGFILFCLLTNSFILQSVGGAVSSFIVGLFGAASYALFGALTAYFAFKISGKKLNIPVGYCVNMIVMSVLTVLFVHLITEQAVSAHKLTVFTFAEYLKGCYNGMSFGGAVSALIIYPAYNTIGALATYAVLILPLLVTVYFTARFFSGRKLGERVAATLMRDTVADTRGAQKGMFVENVNEPIRVGRPVAVTEEPEQPLKRVVIEDKKEEPQTAHSILFSKEQPEPRTYTQMYEKEKAASTTKTEYPTATLSILDNAGRPPKILHDNAPQSPIISDQNSTLGKLLRETPQLRPKPAPPTPPPPPPEPEKPKKDMSAFRDYIAKDIDPSLPPIVSSDVELEKRGVKPGDKKTVKTEEYGGPDLTSPIRKKAEPLSNAVFGFNTDYENVKQQPIISDFNKYTNPQREPQDNDGAYDLDDYKDEQNGAHGFGGYDGYAQGFASKTSYNHDEAQNEKHGRDGAHSKRQETSFLEPKSEKQGVSLSEMFKSSPESGGHKDAFSVRSVEQILSDDFDDGEENEEEPVRVTEKTVTLVETPLSGGLGAQLKMEERESCPELPLRTTPYRPYKKPSVELLDKPDVNVAQTEDLKEKGKKLVEGLEQFGIVSYVRDIISGPTVALFMLDLAAGTSVKQVAKYADDLARMIESRSGLRIIPHIPGKSYFGIEAPHNISKKVYLRELVESTEFRSSNTEDRLYFTLGVDVQGANVIADLSDMPHILVGGSTGTGKSVCLNSLILSLMFKYSPDELRFILIDPKRVEFNMFNEMPHMLLPESIVESDKAINAFNYLINEMEKRYILFQHYKVRDLAAFNKQIDTKKHEPLPRIVLIVDELSDLTSFNKQEIEAKILRLAQKARAAGIHLVIATQRPSVDVITGTIKSNLPARIALRVISQNDSKTILDTGGPEKLLGKGDMLFQREGAPRRVQGAYVTAEEVMRVVDYIKANNASSFSEEAQKEIVDKRTAQAGKGEQESGGHGHENDPLFVEAVRSSIIAKTASISMLQRKLSIGFTRAGNIIEAMEKLNYVSQSEQNRARSILLTKEKFNEIYGEEYGVI